MEMSPERYAAVSAMIARIDAKQNLPLGAAAGLLGALIGAALWAAITATTHYQIGFMAIGVAILVGYGMRRFGNGRAKIFGYVGAAIALLGSVVGNVGTIYVDAATEGRLTPSAALALPLGDVLEVFAKNFNAMDLLFYGIALYYGYRYSMRTLTKEELAALPA